MMKYCVRIILQEGVWILLFILMLQRSITMLNYVQLIYWYE